MLSDHFLLFASFFLLITYLISSLPFGLILAKILAKKDIRQFGSGNIGATNVARILGKKLGLITLILDGAKGAIMVITARWLFNDDDQNFNLNFFLVLVAAIAVIGHIFPIYLKFKGGKGVATALAVLLAINLELGLIACISWLMIFFATRVSSISSLGSLIIALLFALYQQIEIAQIIFCTFLVILIFIRHKENIVRILNNEENKL